MTFKILSDQRYLCSEKHNFKSWAIFVPLLMCLVTISFFPISLLENSIGKERFIKIGVLIPYTGPAAMFSSGWLTGIEKAIKEINSRGGWDNMHLQLIVRDTESDPKVASAEVEKLTKEERVKVILGPVSPLEAMSVADLAEKTKTILISPAMDPVFFQPRSLYTFKIGPTYEDIGRVLATYSSGLSKSKRAAFMTSEITELESVTTIQKSILGKQGFHIVGDEKVSLPQRDFKYFLTKIGRSQADILYLNLIPPFIPIVLKQINEINLKVQTIDPGTLPWYQELVKAAGTSIDKHLSGDIPDYGELGYNTVYLIFEAFTIAGSYQDVDRIRTAMVTKGTGLRFYDWGGPRQVEVKVIRYKANALKEEISTIQFDVPPDPPWERNGK